VAVLEVNMKLSPTLLRRYVFGYAILLPAFLLTIAFFIMPLAQGFITSLRSGLGMEGALVGFHNYRDTLEDPRFWNSLRVSIIFTAVSLLLSGGIALTISIILVSKPPLYQFYLAAIFIPYISTPVIGAMVWQNLLNEPYGLIDVILIKLSLPTVPWLKTPTLALFSLIIVQTWFSIGYYCVLFLAGLQAIPESYFEEAELEGCNWIQKLIHITLPLIIPTIVFVSTMSILLGFVNSFVLAKLITRGGPFEATNVMLAYIFELAFDRFELAKANAVTILIFMLFVGITIAQLRFQKKRFIGLY